MKNRANRAFTIVEIVVAAMIICILAAIVVSQFTNQKKTDLDRVASSIVVQTDGNNQVRITSPSFMKIGEEPCLIIVSHKKGEREERIDVLYPDSTVPTIFSEKDFQERVQGKQILPLNQKTPEYKVLEKKLSK